MTENEAKMKLAISGLKEEQEWWTIVEVDKNGKCYFTENHFNIRCPEMFRWKSTDIEYPQRFNNKVGAEEQASVWNWRSNKENFGSRFIVKKLKIDYELRDDE